MSLRTRGAGVAGLAFALFTVVAGCGKSPPALAPPEPPGVTVVSPQMRDYSPVREFTGRLATKDPVKAIPQVTGLLLKREFEEGGMVVKDKTVLYRIDPTLYQADLEKAKADKARAIADQANWTAQIERDKAEYDRVKLGYDKGVGSKSDLDKAAATVDVDKAQFKVAKANENAADASLTVANQNLGYCTIYAPTDGRAGRSQTPDRSVVTAYQTFLCEIYPVTELYCYWDVDELTSLWYRDQIVRGLIDDPRNPDTPLRCWITLKDGQTFPPPGKPGQAVEYVDPEIIRGTGTRTIRALFPNPEVDVKGPDGKPGKMRLLSGGDSVRVRLQAGRPTQALMIPETAVMSDARQKFVYVVNAKGEAEIRVVKLGATQDGWQLVEDGLTSADRVITTNLLRVRPGVAVNVQEKAK
jgi:RND family efflux transporter MFP subunit